MPLAVSTTWHDAWTGNWISQNGIYQADPSLPLAEGVRHYVDGWAGRMTISWIHQTGGLEVLSLVFAGLCTLVAIVWAWLFTRTANRFWASLFAVGMMAICFQQLNGLSTQTFGLICMALMVALTLSPQKISDSDSAENDSSRSFKVSIANASWFHWLAIVLVAIAWVNLDGSFMIGWAWLLVLLVSRLVALVSSASDQTVKSIFGDRELKSRLVLLELVVLAAICNPIGYKIFSTIFWWPDHPFASSIGTMQPLSLFSWQGAGLAVAGLGWFFASRFATNVRIWQLLVVLLGILAVCWSASLLVWVLPLIIVAGCSMLPRADQAVKNDSHPANSNSTVDSQPALRFAFTLVCALMIWVSFTFSPASHLLLGGKPRSESQVLGPSNPGEAIKVVQQNPDPNRLLWCPSYWGDVIQSNDETLPVFANANLRSLPAQAVFDYEILYNGDNGWMKILDRYGITELMIDKKRQKRMLHNLRAKSQGWDRVHEDGVAVVYRKQVTEASTKTTPKISKAWAPTPTRKGL